MKMGLSVTTGRRWLTVLLVLGSVVALGCGSEPYDDEDEDDTGGSGGGGGLGGFGGSTSGSSSCINVCENLNLCPGETPLDCAESCRLSATDPCAAQADRMFGCLERYDVCALPASVCITELDAYTACADGTGAGNCATSGAPSNASCTAICTKLAPCSDPAVDCVASCELSRTDAATMGCSIQFQSFMGCLSTCTDACALTEDDCAVQAISWLDCEAAFCAANPSATICL